LPSACGWQGVKTSAPSGSDERWPTVVSPEEPERVQLVLSCRHAPTTASDRPIGSGLTGAVMPPTRGPDRNRLGGAAT